MADEYIGLTCQALCDGLSTLKRAYEASDTDFDLRWTTGEFGKGQITTSINIKVLLSDAVSMLKHQQAEIERLKEQVPKKGKWIFTGQKNAYGGTVIQCPFCEDKIAVSEPSLEIFCRTCGAQLREVEGNG